MPVAKKKPEGKVLPYSRVGLNENAAVRMVKVAKPICEECQTEFNSAMGWWDICLDRGHNPYFTEEETFVDKPVITVQEDGRELVTGTERIRKVVETLNTKQVAISERINSGRGYERGQQRKGYKPITDFGYAPVCEFRSCFAPVDIQSSYGNYCGERHARVIAADALGMSLDVSNAQHRRNQLRSIDIYARD